jgi:hypothetical protein
MSTTFKTFLDDDIVSTRTLLHENIPLTGTIISSSVYLTGNIKSYTHGMFQSVYDYPYLSSSANQLLDMTIGQAVGSPGSSSLPVDPFCKKKTNIYNQMAQVLIGHDTTGSILQFDKDGNPATAGDKQQSLFFLNFSRLLSKDEIKKGSFNMTLGIDASSATPFAATCSVSDASGTTNYKINSPVGEYGLLYASGFSAHAPGWTADADRAVGFVFYQAGIVALSTAIFSQSSSVAPSTSMVANSDGQIANGYVLEMRGTGSVYTNVETLLQSGSMDDASAALRNRINNITFNNTTELNSSIHFCRINHNEFNYSSNPTYLSGSKIRVKNKTSDAPVSYVTTVGLYSPDNELLAVAKLSEPLKKDPTQEMILRVRLDY